MFWWFEPGTIRIVDHLDANHRQCYDDRAKEHQVIAGGLDPPEESPNSIEHAAG
jgi:hypothetical protein